MDKVKDLLVVSGIKQTLLDMMYAKKAGNRQRMIKMEQVHLEKITLHQMSLGCGVWQWNKCFSLGFENHRSNWRGRPDGQVILCKFGKADRGKKIKGLFWQRDCECSYNGYYSGNISSKHWGNLADYLAVDRLMKLFSEKVDKKRKFDVKFWYEVSCHETMYYCWQSILYVKGLMHKGLCKLLKII